MLGGLDEEISWNEAGPCPEHSLYHLAVWSISRMDSGFFSARSVRVLEQILSYEQNGQDIFTTTGLCGFHHHSLIRSSLPTFPTSATDGVINAGGRAYAYGFGRCDVGSRRFER